MKIYEEIIKVLKSKGIKGVLNRDTNFKDIGLDSLDLMDLLVNLESEHEILIPDEDILKIKTIGDLEIIIKKIKE